MNLHSLGLGLVLFCKKKRILEFCIQYHLFHSVQQVFDFCLIVVAQRWDHGMEMLLDLLERAFSVATIAQRTQFLYTLLSLEEKKLFLSVMSSERIYCFVEWIYSSAFFFDTSDRLQGSLPMFLEEGITVTELIELMAACKELQNAQKEHSQRKFD